VTVTDVTTTVDAYFDMWNETDPGRRADLIRQAWADDARYLDPLLEADGPDGLSTMVETVHQHYPGQRFTRTSGIDAHHDLVRFAWQLAGPDGTVTVAGIDVGELGADGRLRRITGFFGELPDSGA
jgi:hypothetical protein